MNGTFMANGRQFDCPPLTIYLAAPRGFCAGVDRAIQIVELALAKYGAPVYVRHAIVHNRYVVETLKAKGAIFVEELDEIPDTGAPVARPMARAYAASWRRYWPSPSAAISRSVL